MITEIILRTVIEMKLKKFFENEIILEIIAKPEQKWKLCVVITCVVLIS